MLAAGQRVITRRRLPLVSLAEGNRALDFARIEGSFGETRFEQGRQHAADHGDARGLGGFLGNTSN